jgi:hypothetical protein
MNRHRLAGDLRVAAISGPGTNGPKRANMLNAAQKCVCMPIRPINCDAELDATITSLISALAP